MTLRLVLAAGALLVAAVAYADKEWANEPILVASADGQCYAKSVPDGEHGDKGITRVFKVERGADKQLHTYPWYAQQLYVDCTWNEGAPGASIVRIGPWPRGCKANKETLALAFYLNGQLVKHYSTLEIAGKPENVRTSTHHYWVIGQILGYRWGSGHQRFVVRTVDDRTLIFDSSSGAVVSDDGVNLEGEGASPGGMTSAYVGGGCVELRDWPQK